jgi:hypothetical protein
MNLAAPDATLAPDPRGHADSRTKLRSALETLTVDRVSHAVRQALEALADELREAAERTVEREPRESLLSAALAWPQQRASIESALAGCLTRALASGGHPDSGGKRFAEIRPSWDELGLVDDGVIEDDLRFGELITRIRSDAGDRLVSFDQRMGALTGQADLAGDANPFGPRPVVRALRDALAAASLERQIKHRVMEALTRVACPAIAELYGDLDRLLGENGVHPVAVSLRPSRPRSGPAPAPAAEPAPQPAPSPSAPPSDGVPPGAAPPQASVDTSSTQALPTAMGVDASPGSAPVRVESPVVPAEADLSSRASAALASGGLLGFLATLVPDVSAPGVTPPSRLALSAEVPSTLPMPEALPATTGPETGVSSRPLASTTQVGATDQLIQALTSLQRGAGPMPAPQRASTGATTHALADATTDAHAAAAPLNVLHGLRESPVQGQMGQVDLATLDVMALLFDQIFGDTRIPAAMKALIARLQIPALKVAVLDKDFFSLRTHPARRVLDVLGEIALGLGERFGPGEPLHDRIESMVLDLVAQFEDDMSVFDRCAAELGEILSTLNEQAEEQTRYHAARIRKAEDLNSARRFARAALRQKLALSQAPRSVARFLSSEWHKLLSLARLHQGEDSPAVRNLLKTVDVLLWSLEPKRTVEARRRLVALLPTLLRQLSLGMDTAQTPPRMRQRVDAILLRHHTRALSTPKTGTEQRSGPGSGPANRNTGREMHRTHSDAGALARLADEAFPALFDADPYAGMPEIGAVIAALAGSGDTLSCENAVPSPGEQAAGNAPALRLAGTGWTGNGGEGPTIEPEDTGIVWFTPGASSPTSAGSTKTSAHAPTQRGDAGADPGDPKDSGITWFLQDDGPLVDGDSSSTVSTHDACTGQDSDPTAALQPGVWVEIRGESGDAAQARLSIVSPHRSTFVFSDRAGALVAEYSAYQVETYLRSGHLTVIPEAPLFERALGNLVGLLRRSAN